MNNLELCRRLLGLTEPWRVARVEVDQGSRRLDVWITDQPGGEGLLSRIGLTSRPSAAVSAEGERVWRHLNAGSFRTFVHAQASPSPSIGFLGTAGAPFTNAMAMQIAELLAGGVSYRCVCSVLDLDFKDVWQLKRAGERGESGAARRLYDLSAEAQATVAADGSTIPDVSDPVWEKLVSGERNHAISALGLRLLLSRVQTQLRGVDDPEMRKVKIGELRRYFVNNARGLGGEIGRVLGTTQ